MKVIPSLLSREESNGLKGALILLVVLGHNSLLMEFTGLYSFLYSFHVYAFYILPYIYGVNYPKDNDKNNIKFILKRGLLNFKYFYILLILWSLISLLTVMARGVPFPGIMALCEGYLFNTSLRETFGVGFLWFMPTMVSVLFWRDVYFVLNKKVKAILFSVGVILWGLSYATILDYRYLGHLLPFSIIFGIYFAVQGIATRWLLIHLTPFPWFKWFSPLILLVNYAFICIRDYLPSGCIYITWSILPIIAFCAIFPWKNIFGESPMLKFIGKQSLGIYLIHVFVYNAYLQLVPWHHPLNGVLSFIATLLITIMCIRILNILRLGRIIGEKHNVVISVKTP